MTDTTATAELLSLFPTGILVASIPEVDNAALARAIRSLPPASTQAHGLISGDGVSTYGTGHNLHKRPEFKTLVDALGLRLTGFARELGADLDRMNLLMADCWSNIQQPGSHVVQHRHPNSIISGAYYVEAPVNCGRIVFESPLDSHRMTDFPYYARQTPFAMKRYAVDPLPGRVVLFPSWLSHRTEVNQSNAERIVVSFNVSAHITSADRERSRAG